MTSSLQSPLEDGLPVIDISQFPKEIEGDHLQYLPEVVKLREACEEWGFFRLVNHGASQDLLQKVICVSQDLVSMPMQVKNRITTCNPSKSYGRNAGNSNFCEAMGTFSLFLSDLAKRILKLILVSLGLDSEAFYHSDFEKYRGCLTILHTDEEEGFEVRSKEGRWINVKPSPNSLIVNLGISLKAWSNGRFRCAVPRVICKGWQNRLAVPLFLSFADDARISAPEELVNENNARRYKPFIFCELQSELRKKFEKL
ncbi:hypothetical protein SUGI_0852710 [Cryptomeria japonica]|nr:hypothetical protein SUGI_0852710 [Cryptomeria japonica]